LYSLAGGGVAEVGDNKPSRTIKAKNKMKHLLVIVCFPKLRDLKITKL